MRIPGSRSRAVRLVAVSLAAAGLALGSAACVEAGEDDEDGGEVEQEEDGGDEGEDD
ncbi:MAG: hypothetical protein ACFCVG_15885 [Kineosporiaceae bacterium]